MAVHCTYSPAVAAQQLNRRLLQQRCDTLLHLLEQAQSEVSSAYWLAANSVEGTSSIFGLKMPLSGMVEKTAIIHSGVSQRSARGTSVAWSAMMRQARVADFDLTRVPSQTRG